MPPGDGARAFLDSWRDGVRPEPRLTVSEWAEEHRVLSPRTSARPGPWRNWRAPYLREVMDCLSPSNPARRVVFMKGAQVGATEAGNCWIGYVVHHAPGPMMMVLPTVDDAKKESKQRLAPMFEDCEVLRRRVEPARSRDSGNTILVKEFPGGIFIMIGANTGTGLRGRPIRYLFCDEVDEYPGDVGGQGDPITLAEARTTTFSELSMLPSKIFIVSTPTVRGVSRIEREFLRTDQRRFFLPCPRCGAFDFLRWSRVRWEPNEPATAHLVCVDCGAVIDDSERGAMVAAGEWRPTADGDGRSVGFHLPGFLATWRPLAEPVAAFIQFKDDPFRHKTFVNTVLGETWEEREGGAEPGALAERLEAYGEGVEVPDGVGVIVAAVDVQDDRLEYAVKGYGAAEESWLVAYGKVHGDPATEKVWHDLDLYLRRRFACASGRKVLLECVVVDSGGHHTDAVYRFCRARTGRRVYAIRGGAARGRPGVSKPTRNNRYRTPLFTLCVDTLKEKVYARLRIESPGPGYCHFPEAEWLDDEYFEGLTAEKSILRSPKGRAPYREWVKVRARNEPLDLEVYCLAALDILGPTVIRTLPERARALAVRVGVGAPPMPEAGRPTNAHHPDHLDERSPNEWMDGWR